VRIGILGAARIAGSSVVRPARRVSGVTVAAVAARDPLRASGYARSHGIPVTYSRYEELLADPSLDAIYVPLPNALHGRWTARALEAGKHVLCEKPFTANADEAREIAALADSTGLVVMEAFHYRYHPLSQRILDIVASGELGELRSVDAVLCVPMPPTARNIRWNYELGGGSMMDLGCYAVHMVRTFSGEEPVVVDAEARVHDESIDRFLRAELAFPSGATGSTTVAMWSAKLFSLRLDIRGSHGSMRVSRPISPQFFARIVVNAKSGRRAERTTRRPSYEFQLEAFRDAVGGGPNLTPPADSIATMTVVDAAYRAAGLPLRMPV
jgi:predicted dehydrogenase